ncbi:uncharacterized protein LOC129722118 [Wyeomyia smithii]|uniref:uncharacterized protein LOC129722118 n=1 Tax=Wyeomyia smithii TaxID=174621 RepID=UPI0024680230|nr:uncharacterized protein LOC129722118 [Wyeomyia smithii]
MSSIKPTSATAKVAPASGEAAPASAAAKAQLEESTDYTLDTEFFYYCAVLQESIPALRNPGHQELANKWLTKLSEPSLNMKTLREKRNRFLMMLCICLCSATLQLPFLAIPAGKLPELTSIKKPKFDPPAWQVSTTEWKEHLAMLAELAKKLKLAPIRKCQTHAKQCTGGKDARGTFLDRQFEFFLHLARTYMQSMTVYPANRMACRWVEALSQIDRNCCIRAKGIRNDYALVLTGYLLQHQVKGPFRVLPSHPLEPLVDAARKVAANKPVNRIDEIAFNEKGDFLSNFPLPEEGAFAFISLSSDMMQKMGSLTTS